MKHKIWILLGIVLFALARAATSCTEALNQEVGFSSAAGTSSTLLLARFLPLSLLS